MHKQREPNETKHKKKEIENQQSENARRMVSSNSRNIAATAVKIRRIAYSKIQVTWENKISKTYGLAIISAIMFIYFSIFFSIIKPLQQQQQQSMEGRNQMVDYAGTYTKKENAEQFFFSILYSFRSVFRIFAYFFFFVFLLSGELDFFSTSNTRLTKPLICERS